MNNTTTRTEKSIKENFVTCPNDRFIIPINSNVLSSGMAFIVENEQRGENIRVNCENKLGVWELLRDLDNMGGRDVFVQVDGGELTPFKKSLPYKARFN